MLILIPWRHELVCQKSNFLLIFLIKVIFTKAYLSSYSAIIRIFTVQFFRHKHIIELTVFVLCRLYLNLIGTVREISLPEKPVYLIGMALCSLNITVDCTDDILSETFVNHLALFLKLTLIFRLIILLVLLQQLLICLI